MNLQGDKKRVMIIAGEASGDLHGANLVRAMRKKDSSLLFCGIGGNALKNAGVDILVEASTLSVVGLTEVFAKLPAIWKGLSAAKKCLHNLRPSLLILIDFPDFNLMVAAAAKKLRIPVLYYISPQIWAWRTGRVRKIKKLVDHMAVILPFEVEFYRENDVPVTFVGHPLLDVIPQGKRNDEREKPDSSLTIGLLPGSRDKEVARHLPVMLESAREISRTNTGAVFLVSVAPSIEREDIERALDNYRNNGTSFEIVTDVYEVFGRSQLVVAASGTVTLEAAVSGTPMVIIYKVSPLTFWLGMKMAKINRVGLASLIAGEDVAPELLQEDATSENIVRTVTDILKDTETLDKIRSRLLSVRDILGSPGVAGRTADLALRMLNS